MDRLVFIYTMQAIGLLLAANALGNLAPFDNGDLDKLSRMMGFACLLAGLFMLLWVVA